MLDIFPVSENRKRKQREVKSLVKQGLEPRQSGWDLHSQPATVFCYPVAGLPWSWLGKRAVLQPPRVSPQGLCIVFASEFALVGVPWESVYQLFKPGSGHADSFSQWASKYGRPWMFWSDSRVLTQKFWAPSKIFWLWNSWAKTWQSEGVTNPQVIWKYAEAPEPPT